MTVVIAASYGGNVNPDMLTGYSSSRPSGNYVHEQVANQGPPGYDLNPAGYRTGSFTLVFTGTTAQARAFAAEQLHATVVRFVLTDSKIPASNMTYIVAQGQSVQLGPSALGTGWELVVPFQEVAG